MTVFTPEVIASWPPPNYVDPESLDTPIYVINAICIALSTLFITSRFYARISIIKKGLGADDWTMLAAYFFGVALDTIHMIETKFGVGKHIYDFNPDMAPTIGKIALVKQSFLNTCVVLTKISICLSYLRLFPLTTSKYFSYGMISILTAYGITSGILIGAQCKHIEDTWKILNYNSSCINRSAFYNWQTTTNAVLDLIVFLWPIRYLWNIRMPQNTRLALILCFSCGIIICVIALVRVWLTVRYYQTWDLTWNGAVIYMLASFEAMLGIVCGSLPSIRPLVLRRYSTSTKITEDSMLGRGAHRNKSESRRYVRKPEMWELEDDLATADLGHGADHEVQQNHSLEFEKQSDTSHRRHKSQDRMICS